MSSSDTASSEALRRRPSGMRSFVIISLALHLPLFVYPVLRLSHWLDIGALPTTLILIPVMFSQCESLRTG